MRETYRNRKCASIESASSVFTKWLSHSAPVNHLSDSSPQHDRKQVLIVPRTSAAQYSLRGAAFFGVIALPHILLVCFHNEYKILVLTLSIFSLLFRGRASFTEAGSPLISVPLPPPPWAFLIPFLNSMAVPLPSQCECAVGTQTGLTRLCIYLHTTNTHMRWGKSIWCIRVDSP